MHLFSSLKAQSFTSHFSSIYSSKINTKQNTSKIIFVEDTPTNFPAGMKKQIHVLSNNLQACSLSLIRILMQASLDMVLLPHATHFHLTLRNKGLSHPLDYPCINNF